MDDRPQLTLLDLRANKGLFETRFRYMAQSILHGLVDDPLPSTIQEAVDIIRWHQGAPNTYHNYELLSSI